MVLRIFRGRRDIFEHINFGNVRKSLPPVKWADQHRLFAGLAPRERVAFRDIFNTLLKLESPLAYFPPLDESIKRLLSLWRQYIRDPRDFAPTGSDPLGHFAQLVDHLLVRYPLPAFWENAWYNTRYDEWWCRWFAEIAQGASIRQTVPLPVTRRQLKRFSEAPTWLHPAEALRWAQITDMGGDARVVSAMLASQPVMDAVRSTDAARERFIQELIRWAMANPIVSETGLVKIVAWALEVKFDAFAALRQPNMTMRGRTVATVMRDIEAWERDKLRLSPFKDIDTGSVVWPGAGIEDWHFEQASPQGVNLWGAFQIRTPEHLVAEGREMHHCVADYGYECQDGSSSIWTLRLDGKRCLTLELREGEVAEIRGSCDRYATDEEFGIVQKFARERGLSIGEYARYD